MASTPALAVLMLALAAWSAAARATPLDDCYAQHPDRRGMRACLDAARGEAVRDLGAALQEARQRMAALASATGRRNAARALDHSQRAWVRWRDAECRLAYETLMPGTGAGDASVDCQVRLARDRAAALRALGR